jgi:hypothetical protein
MGRSSASGAPSLRAGPSGPDWASLGLFSTTPRRWPARSGGGSGSRRGTACRCRRARRARRRTRASPRGHSRARPAGRRRTRRSTGAGSSGTGSRPSRTVRPQSGRSRSAASGFMPSRFGLPASSRGVRSHTMRPQSEPPPQPAMARATSSSIIQTPRGSAAEAVRHGPASPTTSDAAAATARQLRRAFSDAAPPRASEPCVLAAARCAVPSSVGPEGGGRWSRPPLLAPSEGAWAMVGCPFR